MRERFVGGAGATHGAEVSTTSEVVTDAGQGVPQVQSLETPGVLPDDSMVLAARKIFTFYFLTLLRYEPGTRLGEDPEDLHKMRVATRRLRAAVRVFQRHVGKSRLKPHLKRIRKTARMLGRVRDLDVAQAKLLGYLKSMNVPDAPDSVLYRQWEAARQAMRAELLAYLDGESYQRFKIQFAEFLDGLDGWEPVRFSGDAARPQRVRHLAPVEIYRRLAEFRAYDDVLPGHDVPLVCYHNLRITGKRLRYTLEFFREVLGPEAETAITRLKVLQDHLGDLQDAVVMIERLGGRVPARLQVRSSVNRPGMGDVPAAARGLCRAKQDEVLALLEAFPALWDGYRGTEFSGLIAAAVRVL